MNLYTPVAIVVLSNTIYHICAKSMPEGVNTFASLSVTYTVGAVVSVIMFFLTRQDVGLFAEYKKLNWCSFALGAAIVGLEAGFLLMYKVGWSISTAQIVSSAVLAAVLLLAGYFLFNEAVTLQKAFGILICLVGLYLINN